MVKRPENSRAEEQSIDPSVFQEYITAARSVHWQGRGLLFQTWLLTAAHMHMLPSVE